MDDLLNAPTTDQPRTVTPVYRILATSGPFEPGFRGGGPIRSLVHQMDTLPADIELILVTRDRDLGSSAPYPGLSGKLIRRNDRCVVFYLNPANLRHWVRLARHLRRQPADLLYVNSLWSLFSSVPILAVASRLLRVRAVLLAPRGELSPGALDIRWRKKKLFLTAWAPVLRRLDVRWHACSGLEERHVRAAFPWARVMVNGNECPIPDRPVPPVEPSDGPLRLVFVSRISPKKNLHTALAALAEVSRPVEFDIFGPREDEQYWARCQQLISTMPGHVRVRYRDELPAEAVLPTFGGYDAFLFPTLGENYGHVILESLAAGCPVVCSDETPFSELIASSGGVVVRPMTVTRLAEALERLAAGSAGERAGAKRTAALGYQDWRRRTRELHVLEHARRFC